MSADSIMRNLEEDYIIPYNSGKFIVQFIDFCIEHFPEESYNYDTSKETYIKNKIELILQVGKQNEKN